VQYPNGDTAEIFKEDLKEDSPWLINAKFKDKYCLTHSSFWLIVDLIKHHPVFQSTNSVQVPVEH
jgi:hypothetical protein